MTCRFKVARTARSAICTTQISSASSFKRWLALFRGPASWSYSKMRQSMHSIRASLQSEKPWEISFWEQWPESVVCPDHSTFTGGSDGSSASIGCIFRRAADIMVCRLVEGSKDENKIHCSSGRECPPAVPLERRKLRTRPHKVLIKRVGWISTERIMLCFRCFLQLKAKQRKRLKEEILKRQWRELKTMSL